MIRLLLGAVPGAAVGRSQSGDEVEQFPEFLFGVGGGRFQRVVPFRMRIVHAGRERPRSSTTCRTGCFMPSSRTPQASWRWQPGLAVTRASAPVARTWASFRSRSLAARLQLLQREGAGHAAAPVRFLHLPQFDPGDRPDDLARRAGKALAVDEVAGFVVGDAQRHRPELLGPDARLREEFGDVADLRPETAEPFMIGLSFEQLLVFLERAAAAGAVGHDDNRRPARGRDRC